MNENIDRVVYQITEGDLQNEANYHLGRHLNEDEVKRAVKLLGYGIGESIGIIYRTIFTEGLQK